MSRVAHCRSTPLICLLLVAAALAVYWQVGHHDFLTYDDHQYVLENLHVQKGLTWANVKWAMTSGDASNWHPLTWVSHMLDVQFFGLEPGRHHLINLLFHAANSMLLFLALLRLTGARWRGAFVAALFALHPLHVESVAWIAERKDVLSAFFFFLMLLCYARYAVRDERLEQEKTETRNPKSEGSPKPEIRMPKRAGNNSGPSSGFGLWSRILRHASFPYVLSLLFFALGLMSKPMLVTTPFVLLLLDYWPLERLRSPIKNQKSKIKNLLWEKAPFFVLSLVSCIITFLVQNAAMVNPAGLPIGQRIVNAAAACVTYLRQIFWPARLAIFYPYPLNPPAVETIAAFALLLTITTAGVLLARRLPFLIVGWCWFLGMLVPVIGLVQVGEQAHADRYTYLPSIGIFVIVAWGAVALVRWRNPAGHASAQPIQPQTLSDPSGACTDRSPMRFLAAPAIVLLAALAIITHRQVGFWRDSQTVFAHAAQVTKDNYVALTGLAIVDLRQGHYANAMTNLNRALECARSHGGESNIKYYLGAALQMQGRGLEALPYFQEATVGPDLIAEKNCRLGVCLMEAGRLDEAEAAIQAALDAKPDEPEFQLSKAALLYHRGRNSEAEQLFRDVAARHPGFAKAHRSLADFLLLMGRPGEARTEYAAAVKLQPTDVSILRAYATALSRLGKTDEAIHHLEAALKLEPANLQMNVDLAELFSEQHQSRRAVEQYDHALVIEPKFIGALNNLSWLLATDPDGQIRNGARAVELAERACRLAEWKAPVLMGTLAAAYAESGRFAEAIETAQKARDLARANKQESVAKKNEELLELYRAGKPYREP